MHTSLIAIKSYLEEHGYNVLPFSVYEGSLYSSLSVYLTTPPNIFQPPVCEITHRKQLVRMYTPKTTPIQEIHESDPQLLDKVLSRLHPLLPLSTTTKFVPFRPCDLE